MFCHHAVANGSMLLPLENVNGLMPMETDMSLSRPLGRAGISEQGRPDRVDRLIERRLPEIRDGHAGAVLDELLGDTQTDPDAPG